MKAIKRIAALALCLALVCTMLPGVSLTAHAETLSGSCGAEGDNLTWTLDTATGVLTIEGYGAMAYYDENPAPWFDYAGSITKVNFSNGLTSIGAFAFDGCTGLTEVTIPEGVSEICWGAFANCSGLATVSLPESLLSIAGASFASCSSLTEISFPKNVWTIVDYAFCDCTSMTSVTIPKTVMYVGSFAFGYVLDEELDQFVNMDGFTIYGYKNTEAEYYANANGISFVSLDDEDSQDPGDVFGYCGANGNNLSWSLTFATGVLTISGSGRMADYVIDPAPWHEYRDSITDVILCEGVTNVGVWAFTNCTALSTMTVPASLTQFDLDAIENCPSLKEINVASGNYLFSSSDGVLMNKAQTWLLLYPAGRTENSYAIPEGVTELGYGAFRGCAALTEVTIPETVTDIDGQAFYNCAALKSVTIPASVRTIGSDAFGYYDNVETNEFYVRVEGFSICGYEETAAQRYANENGFSFVSLGTIQLISGSCGQDLTWTLNPATGVLTIEGSGDMRPCAIEDGIPWYDYRDRITAVILSEGLTSVGTFAFNGCTNLTSVKLPDSVTKIEYRAFYGCTGLTDVHFSAGLKSIGKEAFAGAGLTSAELPEGLTTIDEYAFTACIRLESVRIPTTLNAIGERSFAGCWSLRVLNLPEGLESIGVGAFLACESLTAVTLPRSLKSIGDAAFFACPALRVVTIPASATAIGYRALGFGLDTETSNEYKVEGFTVCGYPGTAAQTYAAENGFRFLAADRFADVTGDSYYFNAVMWAISHDPVITAGVDENLFGAVNPCTREQIVTFLWKAAGAPAPTATSCDFTDVQPGSYYYSAVLWAKEKGITSGMGDGTFGVGQPCTRAQAMTFLWVSQGRPAPTGSNPFTDVEDGAWYSDPIRWAVEHHITAGMGDGTFGVNVTCTRAQIITFLYKAITN